ncbi:ABC transporter permease [Agrobacterium sp. ICMP 6402]|uniref:ABC transporter permease n=1 Tax=Agrobacterium sp. ICMP 6402 TaxID=2292443 RepID=UPI001295867D|nr:ABC transporter permease [Agrobacterium sp. ICMP 6402]MQB12415.1 ABC transporter permease [Agrobacterium sp. ICMP 6402]
MPLNNLSNCRTRDPWLYVCKLRGIPTSVLVSGVVLAIFGITAIFAPLLAPYGEGEVFPQSYAGWDRHFLLGTDSLGRDTLTRLIYGARNSIGVALAAAALSFCTGVALGLVAALNRFWLDEVLGRAADIVLAVPSLIFALMLLAMFGSSVLNIILIIGFLDASRVFRVARSLALGIAVMDYVEAARVRGEGTLWLMSREILPNIAPSLAAEFGLRFSFVFLTIASLSFLGVGLQPPTADWGSMVRETASLITFADFDLKAGITPLLPAMSIAAITVAINFVVDWFFGRKDSADVF